ncbi:MAG: hypothetical protein QM692_03610 [Thermomicrobiales bacterium]
MDPRHFDALAQGLSAGITRRRLLALAAAAPVLGGLLGLLDSEDAGAKDRRRRRKQRHKRRKNPGARKGTRSPKRKPQPAACVPQSVAQTCDGKCGSVTNNCGLTVPCGSCACPAPCPSCFVCQEHGQNIPASCEADPAQQGQTCGDPGQVCQPGGACVCDGGSCAGGQRCVAGACVCDSVSCAAGCCDGLTCHIDDDAACGTNGGACQTCPSPQTCGGGGTAGTCGCTPDCASKACGAADGCGGVCQTGSCPTCQTCVAGVCGADAAQEGDCCDGASGGKQCLSGSCEAKATLAQCQGRLNDGSGYDHPTGPVCGQEAPCSEYSPGMCANSIHTCQYGPNGAGVYCTKNQDPTCNAQSCPAGKACCGFSCYDPDF